MIEPTLSSQCQYLITVALDVMERLDGTDVQAAFLFGSAAWGDADEASDLDIMLLVNRRSPYREVTRIRVPELLGRPLPDGPLFADVDRCSAADFIEAIQHGNWTHRVLHSIVLKDTDAFYTEIRDAVSRNAVAPAQRSTRFHK